MPKSSEQKLKIIYLLQFLSRNTDEDHPAKMADILSYLNNQGIAAERKSIYSDIEVLNQTGYDIVYSKEAPTGYFMGTRDFEIPELKLLVDAVQSSKFITEKKSKSLISKIEKLTSKYLGKQLQRQVYVANRVKTENEAVFYNIDYIHEAINKGNLLEFIYNEWNLDKKLVSKNKGKIYSVEPYMLIWDDENYYLVAFDQESNITKHYRVDKMTSIKISEQKINKQGKHDSSNVSVYSKEYFGMFSGEKDIVKLRVDNSLIGVMIDRFGKNVIIIKDQENTFIARVQVQVSDLFFGWISGFGGKVFIQEPEIIAGKYMSYLENIIEKQRNRS